MELLSRDMTILFMFSKNYSGCNVEIILVRKGQNQKRKTLRRKSSGFGYAEMPRGAQVKRPSCHLHPGKRPKVTST